MRSFSSYGPPDKEVNYYAPRKELIESVLTQLLGENPKQGGYYITVWAPRQTGKSTTLNEALFILRKNKEFDAVKISLETIKTEKDVGNVLSYIEKGIAYSLNRKAVKTDTTEKFEDFFLKENLEKPMILILDEVDALCEEAISAIVGSFRNIYNIRKEETEKPTYEKKYLLHSVALIGVRSVLGIENKKGSPFNVQRSIYIPNLTFEEVEEMFAWHQRESEQSFDKQVIERLYYETKGQPGITCWFGEILTQGCHYFKVEKDKHIDMKFFRRAYNIAVSGLPNNNILNIISKAKKTLYKEVVLDLFRTDEKPAFEYDDEIHNYLYMNGVIDTEESGDGSLCMKFPSPFVQKRLFNYFARQLYRYMGKIYDPLEDFANIITNDSLNIKNLLKRYHKYLVENRDRVIENAPRRTDMRLYEAIFHFNLYMYLYQFMDSFKGEVYPEFPTGNGKIDLLVKYADKTYGIELKTFRNKPAYDEALKQAAMYGKNLELSEITLAFFIENIDDKNRKKLEIDYYDKDTGVTVIAVFVATGDM